MLTFEVSPQSIITAGAVVTAAVLLVQRFANGVRWFDRQEKQTSDIEQLKQQHTEDVEALQNELTGALREHSTELQLLTYGVLACLKGLQETGCNGPVTEAVNKIEKYLNHKAHGN